MVSPVRHVPLLWLGLFDYDETAVCQDDAADVFRAQTAVPAALQRARTLAQALPAELARQCSVLVRALERCAAGGQLVLHPERIFSGLQPRQGRAYLQQLVHSADLLERLRQGAPWAATRAALEHSTSSLAELWQLEPDQQRDRLVGREASGARGLEQLLVRAGQGEDDTAPEALAAGDNGLLLGRFAGQWKLMSSGCERHLRGIWGLDQTAYLVGAGGAVVRLRDGRCATLDVPVDQDLNAVWGLSARMVCVVGDEGKVLMFTGRNWQPWVVPFDGALYAITGAGPEEICISGAEPAVLRFDGFNWNRLDLPEGGEAHGLCYVDEVVHAAGRSRFGGELFRLERRGFVQDKTLPTTSALSDLWPGWGATFGVLPESGDALYFNGQAWAAEAIPADRLHACAGGAHAMAVGRSGSYSVILARGDNQWRVEASLRGQRLAAIWVAGRPKPSRLPDDAGQQD